MLARQRSDRPTSGALFAEVYERHWPRILGFCLLRARSRGDAEDLAMDVMEAAYRSYDPTKLGNVEAWLFEIARNKMIDSWRKSARRSAIERVLGRRDRQIENVEDVALHVADLNNVVAAVRRLKRKDQEVISLRIGAGLTQRELANVLKVSENTAASRIRRAFDRLRTEMEAT